ncbi:MAG: hypothetical protein HY318_20285 [Armatimonadetes bacterium]|nr:hypothetical protein [Armatimonadota bacterium]
MTSKERVLAVLDHGPTDRIPIYVAGLSSRVASSVLGREAYVGGGIQQWREARALWNGKDAHTEYLERSQADAFKLCDLLDLDLVRPLYWRMPEKPTEKIDEHNYLYGDPGKAWVLRRFDPETELYQVVDQRPAISEESVDIKAQVESAEKSLPDYTPTEQSFPELRAALDHYGDRRAVPGHGVGISIPYQSRSWLTAIVEEPEMLGRYLDVQAERAVRTIEAQANMGLKFLMGGGDFASNRGPFYSPAAFHKLMLPRLQKVSEACREHGCIHAFASDGNLWPVAEDLFGASGVEAFYEIDRRAGMDLRRLRETFPHLTLLGNISSYILHFGTKEEVIAETLDCLETAKEYGSLIVGPSNQVVAQTPVENFEVMMQTLHNFRGA